MQSCVFSIFTRKALCLLYSFITLSTQYLPCIQQVDSSYLINVFTKINIGKEENTGPNLVLYTQ